MERGIHRHDPAPGHQKGRRQDNAYDTPLSQVQRWEDERQNPDLRESKVTMLRLILGALGAVALALPVAAQVQPFPASFRTQKIETDGATLHVRVGGQGPVVVLLHGFGDTGDMWAPLAADLARDHTVVVPDLRGMGLSSRPDG